MESGEEVTGTLFGIGLGPGDPGLITRKAAALIKTVPVIAYPTLAGKESFARGIAGDLIPDRVREIAIDVPMTEAREPAQAAYDAGAAEIARALSNGDDVACLCEGDPFVYGSFMYLYARLVDRFRIQVIPGVTSLTACAANAGIPLAARSGQLTVLPGTLSEDELARRIDGSNCVAVLKVGRHLPKLISVITQLGLLNQATYVEHATLADEHICPLADAPGVAPYFSMILIEGNTDPWL